ncbi:hypothetical protein N499_1364 [Wolbachia pipientis wVitA]|nr:hypothetical protein N499_1364 [Wolbachia pipientis wVitA]
MIIPYSAIKIKANLPLIYSVLNPDTNSDSPSAKSKGVRFNSANNLTKKIILKGKKKNKKNISLKFNYIYKIKSFYY